ncbi:hypothetical protein B0J11DRAFT_215962 [Dendryphion nanum]|uniref:Uncharacterized protein n=1 Tax=Dendryphion nanum TaxID=256645 RepID=A0A9P9E8T8_9PLEO|nr:hypothetical protein B0J11DRAFT_215962 [Dendryphion nanum]
MAPSSTDSNLNFVYKLRDHRPISHESSSQERTPTSERDGRVDSNEIRGCGIWSDPHSAQPPMYPAYIDAHELDDGSRPPQMTLQSLSVVAASTVSAPTPRHLDYIQQLGPGIFRAEDVEQLINPPNRDQRRRPTVISENRSNSSNYVSARLCSTDGTEKTEHENNNDGDGESPRAHSEYFTPSHTPSHHSLGTIEGEPAAGQPPGSPNPFSTYHLYDEEQRELALASFDASFPGLSDNQRNEQLQRLASQPRGHRPSPRGAE